MNEQLQKVVDVMEERSVFQTDKKQEDWRYSAEALKQSLRNVKHYVRLPLLYEYWYVAGLAEEFSRTLMAKTILNRSIVFFRKESGELVALQNRCAHRSYPLSESHLEGDTIRCGYHGIRYDASGKILNVPCQAKVPPGGVKSYDVHETGPFVWIWMGEGKGDLSRIPDMTPYMDETRWSFSVGGLPVPGTYLLMQENLADLSHLPYLHASTFGIPESWGARPIEMKVDEEKMTVDFYRESRDWKLSRTFFPPDLNYEGRDFVERAGGHYESPAFHRGWDTLKVNDAKPGERDEFHVYFDHFLTPESHTHTHYYYGVARNSGIDNVEYIEATRQVMKAAFTQDSEAVRHVQNLLDNDQHDFRDLMIAGDKPAIATRRMILKLVEREYGPASRKNVG